MQTKSQIMQEDYSDKMQHSVMRQAILERAPPPPPFHQVTKIFDRLLGADCILNSIDGLAFDEIGIYSVLMELTDRCV